jgi:hypothetical protein
VITEGSTKGQWHLNEKFEDKLFDSRKLDSKFTRQNARFTYINGDLDTKVFNEKFANDEAGC